ncbi:hypothetical protein AURDEDRAFT_112670 [Auricularia subglabra TFB-10046 SS5]|nr:hypothetical protein AURDEDRAFT_112670 [Auricularia subglabra TFB-10046 SS5]
MVASFIVLALAVAGANALTINTPTGSLNECQNFLLTWDGANNHQTQISVFPQGQVSGQALETLPPQTGNSYTWLVDLAPGAYTLVIKDLETGESAASGAAQITPNPSGDTSCEGKNGSSPPGTGTGTTPPGDSTTPPGEQTTPPASTPSNPGNTTPPPTDNGGGSSNTGTQTGTSSGSGATQTPPNGAASLSAKGATGLLGLLAAFLLA